MKAVSEIKKYNLRDLMPVVPASDNQALALEAILQGNNAMLMGSAGTGKTFLAMYAALRLVLDSSNACDRVIVVRSAVATRDVGFLPGTLDEKMAVFEMPYVGVCTELFGHTRAWDTLKKNGCSLLPTSYIRGTTLDNAIVVVDECQNLTFHELDSVITRCGVNSQLIFCGDTIQSDLRRCELDKFNAIVSTLASFDTVTFGWDDIVRSGLVKDYIIARDTALAQS